jgi:hypothetical protein
MMIALERLLDRIMADNPIATVPQGLFHFEIRTEPNIALHEALLNALVHSDYRIHGPSLVTQFKHRIEIGACAMPLMFHFSQRLAQRLVGCQSEAIRRILCAFYARSMRPPIGATWLGGKRQVSTPRTAAPRATAHMDINQTDKLLQRVQHETVDTARRQGKPERARAARSRARAPRDHRAR